jgi:N6-adenosine-specific RNA methylase IME4
MGRLFRQTHEICLIGTRGKIYKQLANKSQRSVGFAENLRHSAKPEDLQDSLEIMFPKARKLELFARRIRPDWTCLGNEIDGKDIRDALAAL